MLLFLSVECRMKNAELQKPKRSPIILNLLVNADKKIPVF
jgi:hypothetical protein